VGINIGLVVLLSMCDSAASILEILYLSTQYCISQNQPYFNSPETTCPVL
jgi:hypothetical protein